MSAKQAGWTEPHEFPEFERGMRKVGDMVGDMLPPGIGFALFLFEFKGEASTYISNAQREDMVTAVLEWVFRQDRATTDRAMARIENQQRNGPEAR